MLHSTAAEVKTHPRKDGPLEFEDLGGITVGLLFRMTNGHFSTGRYIILDYGLCVLEGLIQLSNKCVFACAIIKR